MISKDKIINRTVDDAADIIEMKMEYIELVAKQFEEKGELDKAEFWRRDIPAMKVAIELIRDNSGCWS